MADVICSMCGTLAAEDAGCGCASDERWAHEAWIDINAICARLDATHPGFAVRDDDAGRELGGSD